MRLDRHHKGRPRGDLFRREQGRGFGWGVWGQQVFASGRIPTSSGSSVRSATNAHSSSINDFGPIINPVADIRLPPTRGRAIHPTGVAIADVALARTPVHAAMSGSDPVGSGSVKGGDVTNFDACISYSHTQEAACDRHCSRWSKARPNPWFARALPIFRDDISHSATEPVAHDRTDRVHRSVRPGLAISATRVMPTTEAPGDKIALL
jgi:hypothetical protein